MDIEQRLRDSLAPRAAPPDFESAVMARVRDTTVSSTAAVPAARRGLHWRIPAALAATVLAAASGLHWYAEQQRAAQAGEQLRLALAITSDQLSQVQQKLTRAAPNPTEENGI